MLNFSLGQIFGTQTKAQPITTYPLVTFYAALNSGIQRMILSDLTADSANQLPVHRLYGQKQSPQEQYALSAFRSFPIHLRQLFKNTGLELWFSRYAEDAEALIRADATNRDEILKTMEGASGLYIHEALSVTGNPIILMARQVETPIPNSLQTRRPAYLSP